MHSRIFVDEVLGPNLKRSRFTVGPSIRGFFIYLIKYFGKKERSVLEIVEKYESRKMF